MKTEHGGRSRRAVVRPAGRAARPLAIGVTLAAAVLVVAGIEVTTSTLAAGERSHRITTASGNGPFAIGQAVRGHGPVVEVTGVEQLGGPTAKDLGNANHGIANGVSPNQVQVQVSVRLINDSDSSTTYSSRSFLLRIGTAPGIRAMSTTFLSGRIAPGASVEGNLGFVAPRRGARLRLQLPGKHGPVLVDLGRADSAAPVDDGHHH